MGYTSCFSRPQGDRPLRSALNLAIHFSDYNLFAFSSNLIPKYVEISTQTYTFIQVLYACATWPLAQ
jgi:hypothetical protein